MARRQHSQNRSHTNQRPKQGRPASGTQHYAPQSQQGWISRKQNPQQGETETFYASSNQQQEYDYEDEDDDTSYQSAGPRSQPAQGDYEDDSAEYDSESDEDYASSERGYSADSRTLGSASNRTLGSASNRTLGSSAGRTLSSSPRKALRSSWDDPREERENARGAGTMRSEYRDDADAPRNSQQRMKSMDERARSGRSKNDEYASSSREEYRSRGYDDDSSRTRSRSEDEDEDRIYNNSYMSSYNEAEIQDSRPRKANREANKGGTTQRRSSASLSSGNRSASRSSGNRSHTGSSGNRSASPSSGNRSHAGSSGNRRTKTSNSRNSSRRH